MNRRAAGLAALLLFGCETQKHPERLTISTSPPTCGEGPIIYLEWQCTRDFGVWDWRLQEVGYRNYNCQSPYLDTLVGHVTECYSSERIACGGGGTPCTFVRCETPRPTAACPPDGGCSDPGACNGQHGDLIDACGLPVTCPLAQ